MRRRTFLKASLASAAAVASHAGLRAEGAALKPPNMLWLSAEDLSPDLGCYGDGFATTPNLDAFATRALRYDRAYACAGVCAPSRSGIITGMYPTSIGTQHMRCQGIPPAGVKCFSEYLRGAGYYCTNNSKTDYQFDPPRSAWDENGKNAHWKNRPEDAPFFAVFNFTTTHEGQVRSEDPKRLAEVEALGELRHDPAKVTLPPYHADTPATRADWARYYDLITLMDREVGAALAELEAAGLAEDTIVWFWGDHGRGLTRCKRWLYESGTRAPLLIHVPEKYRAWVRPEAPDSLASGVTDQLVSFIDFAPTVLSMAGVPLPEHFEGQAFLGRDAQTPREYVYGARDRMDEAYDVIRTVRDKRYRYFRNYMPWRPCAQRIEYMDQMPMAKDLRRLHAEGKLNANQSLWFAPTKPDEELYDLETDPHEINNLAADPAHKETLERLRQAHLNWSSRTKDLGLIPEPMLDAAKWPDGESPACAPPVAWRGEGGLMLGSATPGASVVYQLKGEKRWRLYSAPLPIDRAERMKTMACRAGYEDSGEVAIAMDGLSDGPVQVDPDQDWRAPFREQAFHCYLRYHLANMLQGEETGNLLHRTIAVSTAESSDASEKTLPIVQYWSLARLQGFGLLLESDRPALTALLDDSEPAVQIAAAGALASLGGAETALPVLVRNLEHKSQSVRLHAIIALAELGEEARPAAEAITRATGDSWTYVMRVSTDLAGTLGLPTLPPAAP